MQQRTWELQGEVSSKSRPSNSLLEIDAEWETTKLPTAEVGGAPC